MFIFSKIKKLLSSPKDAMGQNIDRIFSYLAIQHQSTIYCWSYIQEQSCYEDITNGRRVYAYELPKLG